MYSIKASIKIAALWNYTFFVFRRIKKYSYEVLTEVTVNIPSPGM